MDGLRRWLALLVLVLAGAVLAWPPAIAQPRGPGDENIRAAIAAEGPAQPGTEWLVALHFTPRAKEWHGYWSNPGDAGLGMELDWDLPPGWSAGEPRYPVPQTLVIGGLMNHVYEGEYAVIVPLRVPSGALASGPVRVTADYLACTDRICVPQRAELMLDPAAATRDPRFDRWLAALGPPLGSPARFEISGEVLRVGIPLPAAVQLGVPHLFIEQGELGDGLEPRYADTQTFRREGDLLVAEVPLTRRAPVPGFAMPPRPAQISGILAFGIGTAGVAFAAAPGDVPLETAPSLGGSGALPALPLLLLAALAGGILLNIMPCVFPILSLKALALAKAGGAERAARRDALAYSAGVVIACTALGALILVLRAAGEQVGWAFQLQEPWLVVALFLLALAITANFLGLFEVPGVGIAGGKSGACGSFATGLLAAVVATPCTGPFMAVALGAALVIPPIEGLLVFVALGIGLALPFLLLGFVPALRARLPRPGPWMERFRRWMALPMGLTALALGWLVWRIGGANYLAFVALLGVVMVIWLVLAGRLQRRGRDRPLALFGLLVAAMVVGLIALPAPSPAAAGAETSLLEPQPFSDAALARARASGRPVFLWFTADWCVSCKVNESVAIERESTRDAFAKAGVIAMRGDWTRRDPAIARFLTEHGAAGVPLYLWYAPGREAEQLPQVLSPDLLARLAARTPPGIAR